MITTDRRKVLGDIHGTAYDCVLELSLTGLADCRSNKTSNFDRPILIDKVNMLQLHSQGGYPRYYITPHATQDIITCYILLISYPNSHVKFRGGR